MENKKTTMGDLSLEQVKAEAKKRFSKDLTDEQAQAYLDANLSGELREEDLEKITGGIALEAATASFDGGLSLEHCPQCGSTTILKDSVPNADGLGRTKIYKCDICGHVYSAGPLVLDETARG